MVFSEGTAEALGEHTGACQACGSGRTQVRTSCPRITVLSVWLPFKGNEMLKSISIQHGCEGDRLFPKLPFWPPVSLEQIHGFVQSSFQSPFPTGPDNFLQPECPLSPWQQHPAPWRSEQAGCPPSAPEPDPAREPH